MNHLRSAFCIYLSFSVRYCKRKTLFFVRNCSIVVLLTASQRQVKLTSQPAWLTHCNLPRIRGESCSVRVDLQLKSLLQCRLGFLPAALGGERSSRERWAGVSGCAGEIQFSCNVFYTSANHLTQWSVHPAGDSYTSPLPLPFPHWP